MEQVSTLKKEYEEEYSRAVAAYIEQGGETSLQRAYTLGRRALDEGKGILDVLRFHSATILEILEGLEASQRQKAILDGSAFFSEFLSPFEMMFKGFLETVASLKREISERQHAEEALAQSERYYKSLIENSLDIVTILDGNGTMRYRSPSGQRVLGWEDADLVGRNIFEFVHPDDVDLVLEIFSTAKDRAGSTATAEFRFRLKKGGWVTLEAIGKNLLDDPYVKGIIVNSRDITDRRNLEEIRRKYEFIVNASRECMFLINVRGEFEAVNEAGCLMLQKHREEIVGKRINEVLAHDSFQSRLLSQLERGYAGAYTKWEDWYELPVQGRRYLEIDCSPYRGVLTNVSHVIVLVRDATERKEDEDKIRDAQRLRAEDLRRYAQLTQQAQEEERKRISRELHDDICQRLTALKLHLNVFEDSLAQQKKLGARRLRSTRKEIDSLINEVRLISHNLRPSTLDHFGLPTSLRHLCTEYRTLNSAKIEFETNIAAHRRYKPDTEIALYRIAQEALANCVRHASAPEVLLTATETDSQLTVTIADHGNGFDLQAYAHRSPAEKHFGLVNMRERIELCGGNLSIESAPGKGTTIRATVPVA